MLVIHGGRNDHIFSTHKNTALNDLHILDLRTLCWQSIVMYGEVPEGRWGHQIAINETQSVIVIFGGLNLQGYCEANVYQF